MPIATINILEGRTDEQKEALIEQVTEAICNSLGSPIAAVRVIINEMPSTQFGIGGKTAKALGR
ncbi:MAG: 2-hydroxymuconate tautomerase [Piscirickettsiaceae bacterium]|nr:MAG: 2-hydroxymuconate tautomerase [Piscirickettsiaceae bacterium]PCI72033.1 MAG: 2-hydroxymuconate tautomerase [Piscirickettsiaceae bacterium]